MIRYFFIFLFFISCSNEDRSAYTPNEIVFSGDALLMLKSINESRKLIGVDTLVPERRMTYIAERYSLFMDSTGYFSHSGFYDRQTESECYSFGECLSYNYTVASSFEAYVLSKSHSQTLTNPRYTHIGYGRSGKYECVLLGGYDIYKSKQEIDTITVKFKK